VRVRPMVFLRPPKPGTAMLYATSPYGACSDRGTSRTTRPEPIERSLREYIPFPTCDGRRLSTDACEGVAVRTIVTSCRGPNASGRERLPGVAWCRRPRAPALMREGASAHRACSLRASSSVRRRRLRGVPLGVPRELRPFSRDGRVPDNAEGGHACVPDKADEHSTCALACRHALPATMCLIVISCRDTPHSLRAGDLHVRCTCFVPTTWSPDVRYWFLSGPVLGGRMWRWTASDRGTDPRPLRPRGIIAYACHSSAPSRSACQAAMRVGRTPAVLKMSLRRELLRCTLVAVSLRASLVRIGQCRTWSCHVSDESRSRPGTLLPLSWCGAWAAAVMA